MGSESSSKPDGSSASAGVPKRLVTEMRSMQWEMREVIRRLEVLSQQVDKLLVEIAASADDEDDPEAL